jgi:hypothetical protein
MKFTATIALASLSILLFVSAKTVRASEGLFEIRSISGEDARCYATSLLMADGKYQILLGCRDLIFPPQGKIGGYILWAKSSVNGDIFKLGSIGIGKASFSTKDPFNQLFITIEENDKIRVPSENVVMNGGLTRIEFLENTLSNQEGVDEEVTPTRTINQEQVEVPQLTTREKLLIGMKRSGIIAGVALIGLIGLILVITRSRG